MHLESSVEVSVLTLVFLLGGERVGTRLSVLVLLCLAWQTEWQPSSWLMSEGHILHLTWKWSWSERKRAALASKVGSGVKSQSTLEGSRRGELFPTQIPKVDGARRLSVLKRNAICIDLKSFEWLQRAIGCELRAAGWRGWPCCCCKPLCCKSLCSKLGTKTQIMIKHDLQISGQRVHLTLF